MDFNFSDTTITEILLLMAQEDKQSLIEILQASGSLVNEESTTDELLDASLKALMESEMFRQDLRDYLITETERFESGQDLDDMNESSNYVDDDFFSNGNGKEERKKRRKERRSVRQERLKKQRDERGGKTRVGSVLSSIFSDENISTATSTLVNYASKRLENKANQLGNQQAIDYEIAQAEKLQSEKEKIEAEGLLGKKEPSTTTGGGGKKKWVLPVAIIGGVLIIGTILYFTLVKKKSATPKLTPQ
jgi:hypothetical protein